jgi:RNA polymerase sigma-70 factor, ECF subfamily
MTDAADIDAPPPSSVPDPSAVAEDPDEADRIPVDETAFFDTYYPFVFAVLERLKIPWADAKDIAQEVASVTWRRRKEVPPKRMKGWIVLVTYHETAHHRRKARKRIDGGSLPESQRDGGRLVDPGLDPEQALIRAQAQDLVRACLEQMKPEARRVFSAIEIQGMSYGELAEAHGVSEETINGRLRRARVEFKAAHGRVTAQRGRRGAA